jgi:MFS family permease
MLKVCRPSLWLSPCMVGWGATSALQAACTDGASLAAVRFFLGLFEASFAPGCALYLSFWYLKSELSLRIAAYAGTSALSGVVGGLIAYGLGAAKDHMALKAWQTVFIVEGVPTVILGIATYFYLPDRPELGRHSWFTKAEHEVLLSRRTRFVRNKDSGIELGQVSS